jgi:hypothetical protein
VSVPRAELFIVPFKTTGLPLQLVCGDVGFDATKGTVLAVGAGPAADRFPSKRTGVSIDTAKTVNPAKILFLIMKPSVVFCFGSP